MRTIHNPKEAGPNMVRQAIVVLRGMIAIIAIMSFLSVVPQQAWADESMGSTPEYTESLSHSADKNVGYGAETSFLMWHGYLNFEFDKRQGKQSTFDNHEFYLSAQAFVSKKLSLTAEFEYEHTPEKLILPLQAFVDYKLSDAFTFRAGQFYTPMGIARSYNLRGNKNRMIRQVALTHDIMFENWADVGINVFGSFPSGVFYDIALGNGMPNTMATGDSFFDATDDLQSHSEDNNANKAIHSRIGYASADIMHGELNAAISLGTQKYDDEGERVMTHTGADLRFLHESGFRCQVEYMHRSGDDHVTLLAEKNISADATGWYVQVSKRFVSKSKSSQFFNYVEPVIQVDFIDLNTNMGDTSEKLTTAIGIIFSPEQNYLLKFEYDIVSEQFGDAVDNNMFWAAVVLEF